MLKPMSNSRSEALAKHLFLSKTIIVRKKKKNLYVKGWGRSLSYDVLKRLKFQHFPSTKESFDENFDDFSKIECSEDGKPLNLNFQLLNLKF